jgi:hypothetical protein
MLEKIDRTREFQQSAFEVFDQQDNRELARSF